ncbi:uncharacterized protein LOC144448570 [Glandiceps talaboti]
MDFILRQSSSVLLVIMLVIGRPVTTAVISHSTSQTWTQLSCPNGQFVYKIPPGIYTNDDGVDQSLDPGYICRQCQVCPDGAKVTTPCNTKADTVCGDCVEKDHIFDQGTKSCQPKYIVEGRPEWVRSKDVPTTTRIDVDLPDSVSTVSSSTINTLFVAAVTLFTIVTCTAVILSICCTVTLIRDWHNKNRQRSAVITPTGRNLPSKILAFTNPKGKGTETSGKNGHVNDNYTEDVDAQSQYRPLCDKERKESVCEYLRALESDKDSLIKNVKDISTC